MSPDPKSELKILAFGLDPAIEPSLTGLIGQAELLKKDLTADSLGELPDVPGLAAIFCGAPPEGIRSEEVAQTLRMQFQTAGIYFVTAVRAGFDRKNLVKNGFSDAFLIPTDLSQLSEKLKSDFSRASSGAIRVFKSVRLIDLQSDTVLPFDTYVYLPFNKKHVHYGFAGDSLESDRLERLKKRQLSSVEIPEAQKKAFYDFTASQLRKLSDGTGISETERQDRMRQAVRDIISGIFSDSSKDASTVQGKEVVADCQEIVKSFILSGTQSGTNSWYEKILSATGSASESYNHASNVATFAALFSMATRIGKPDELALAGLLHDIGLVDVPSSIQNKDPNTWTSEERELYQKHPEFSLDMIRSRKLVVTDMVIKLISLHHERLNGSGYPKKIDGKRFIPEAQVLAIADEFDEMTSTRPGHQRLTPIEAINQIAKRATVNASIAEFSNEIVAELLKIFPSSAA